METFGEAHEALLLLHLRGWLIGDESIRRPHDVYVPDPDEWLAVKYLIRAHNYAYLRREEDDLV